MGALRLRHRLDRVHGQVHDHLLNLRSVAENLGQRRRQFEGDVPSDVEKGSAGVAR